MLTSAARAESGDLSHCFCSGGPAGLELISSGDTGFSSPTHTRISID